jgi:hypothetical protein
LESKKHILHDSTSKGHNNHSLFFPRHLNGPDKIQWKKDDYDVRYYVKNAIGLPVGSLLRC